MQKNLGEKFAILKSGPHYNQTLKHGGYNTMEQAVDDGAVILAYGCVTLSQLLL
jgi:large conductance mechanosensitive channel